MAELEAICGVSPPSAPAFSAAHEACRNPELLEKLLKTQHNYGFRLNAIRWQAEHRGLVKTKP